MVGDVTGIIAVEGAYDRSLVDEKKSKAVAFVGSQGLIFDITRYKKAEKNRLMFSAGCLKFKRWTRLEDSQKGLRTISIISLPRFWGARRWSNRTLHTLRRSWTFTSILLFGKHARGGSYR